MSYRQTAMDNRYKLLLSLSYLNKSKGAGPSATAYEVARQAKKLGFTEEFKTPKGSLYDVWITTKKIPAWAVRSVATLLLDEVEYKPGDESEKQSLVLMIAEAFDLKTKEELKEYFHDSLAIPDSYFDNAIASKNKNLWG